MKDALLARLARLASLSIKIAYILISISFGRVDGSEPVRRYRAARGINLFMNIAIYQMTGDGHRREALRECERAGYIAGMDDDGGVFLVVEHPDTDEDHKRVRDAVMSRDPGATHVE